MRTFESLLIAFVAARVVAALLPRAARAEGGGGLRWGSAVRGALSLLAAAGLATHLVFEGARWQLFGLYPLALALLARDLVEIVGVVRARPRSLGARLAAALVGAAVTALVAAPAALMPVPRLLPPTGPNPVGSDAFEFVRTAEADAERRVRVRVWYPAAPSEAPRAPYLEHPEAMLPAMAAGAGLPGWALGHLRHIETHARWGAPPAESSGAATLPVVTFDHGRGGYAAQNTFLAEELASRGWLVLAPEHPGGALRTVFRDGTAVGFDPAEFGADLEGAAYDAAIRAVGRSWIADTTAALEALASPEAAAPGGPRTGPQGAVQLIGRADATRMVATGHSTGGGAAFGVCAALEGCRGAVGLDPWLLPTPPALVAPPPTGGMTAPLLALRSDPELGFFEPGNRVALERLLRATRARGATAEARVLTGAGHNDFTDIALLSPLAPQLELDVGPLPALEAHRAVRRAVVGWVAALER